MREVQLVPFLLEQVGEPLPTVGRLECDLQLAAELGQDRLQRLWLVRDSARQQLRPLLIESSDLRTLAMEIDTDLDHLLGPPSPLVVCQHPWHTASGTGTVGGPAPS